MRGFFIGGQFTPSHAGEIEEAAFWLHAVHEVPPIAQEVNAELHVLRELIERRLSVLVLPTSQHVIGLAHVFVVLRQMRRGFLLIPHIESLLRLSFHLLRPAQADAVRMKHDAGAWHDRGVVGEFACGGEILVDGRWAHEKHVAGVREALTATAIGLEFFGE